MGEIIRINKGFIIMAYAIFPISILLSCKVASEKEIIIPIDEGRYLKGIAAIFVVLHHLAQRIGINIMTIPYIEIGKYAVALFLALSGYGVMNSLKNKKNYLNGFLKSRIAKVYVPFILSNCIFLCIKYLNNENFDMLQIIKYILGIELIDSSMWFIIMIMVCYVIFYLIFKFTDIKSGMITFTIINILYFLIAIYLKVSVVYINISFCFLIGMYLSYREEMILIKINNGNILKVLITLILLIVTRVIGICISDKYLFIDMIFNNLSTIFFVLMLVILLRLISFKLNIYSFIGMISFSIYLLHNKIMYIFIDSNKSVTKMIVYFTSLLFASIIFNKLICKIKINRTKIVN